MHYICSFLECINSCLLKSSSWMEKWNCNPNKTVMGLGIDGCTYAKLRKFLHFKTFLQYPNYIHANGKKVDKAKCKQMKLYKVSRQLAVL